MLLPSIPLLEKFSRPGSMRESHHHSEIEINYFTRGSMRYLLHGSFMRMPARRLAIFWAVAPHRAVDVRISGDFYCLNIPLERFLRWGLDPKLTEQLLAGGIGLETVSQKETEHAFQRWHADLETWKLARVVELEAEAQIRRLWARKQLVFDHVPPRARGRKHSDGPAFGHVAAMACHVAQHYLEPIYLEDVARAAGLNSNYAATHFREVTGQTVGGYINQYRLHHAQRLLATTDRKVLDIALASGFESLSRFYVAFEKTYGLTPQRYRKRLSSSAAS